MLAWALKKLLGTSHEREVKKLKPLVEEINKLEPTISKLTDAELKAKTAEFKQKLDNGATLDDILVEAFAVCREARQARAPHAPLRRAAHRRHGPPQGHDRRDAHRRGQDPRRDARLLPERARGQGRPRRHRERLPRPPRRGVDGQALRLPRPDAPASSSTSRATREKRDAYRSRHHVRPEQRVRLRLPARQHEVQRARLRAARAELRDRRRGRLDPHRRGAHAAHHQRPGRDARARSTSRSTRCIPRLRKDEHYIVDEKAHSRHAHRRRRRAWRRSSLGVVEPLRPGQPRVAAHPEPVPARAHALQARRELPRHRRRQGPHHRRVHRPRARRVVAGPTVCTRPSRPRRTCRSRKRPGRWRRSRSRTSSASTRSSPA